MLQILHTPFPAYIRRLLSVPIRLPTPIWSDVWSSRRCVLPMRRHVGILEGIDGNSLRVLNHYSLKTLFLRCRYHSAAAWKLGSTGNAQN